MNWNRPQFLMKPILTFSSNNAMADDYIFCNDFGSKATSIVALMIAS